MKISTSIFQLLCLMFVIGMAILHLTGSDAAKVVTGFWLMLIAPGLALYAVWSPKKVPFSDACILTVGFSLSLIILYGLLGSITRDLTNIPKPLNLIPTLFVIVIWCTICHTLAAWIHKKKHIPITVPWIVLLLGIPFFLINILSVIAAFTLNVGASSVLTILILTGFPMLSFFVVLLSKLKRLRPLLILNLFCMSVSLQWALSLRSWHISGFDISTEFKVFSLTKTMGFWQMSNFQNAYNACLSITILPTVLSNFIPLPPDYIFKLVYPILFAIVPVIIYRIWRSILNYRSGFLSSFFFLSFPWYIDPLTTILRQEIAFLFFGLMLFILFQKSFPKSLRRFSFYLFGAMLVFSHYSTTYATLILLFTSYMIFLLVLMIKKTPYFKQYLIKWPLPILQSNTNQSPLITPIFLIYFIFVIVIWNGFVTKTSGNLEDLFSKVYDNVISSDQKIYSGMIDEIKGLFGKPKAINPYENFKAQKIKQFSDAFPLDPIPLQRVTIVSRTPEIIPIQDVSVFRSAQKIFRYLTIFSALLPFIAGIIAIFGFSIIKLKEIPWLSNLWVAVYGLVAAIIFVPYVSIGYNFERVFMHGMLITAVSPALLVILLSKIVKKIWIPYSMILCTLFFFYLFNYGIVWSLIGGKPVMWLHNKGISYDLTYSHTGEIAAAEFLEQHGSGENIHSSSKGRNILTAYSNPKSINSETLSLLVIPGSYIFAHHVNVTQQMEYFNWAGSQTAYTYQSGDFDSRFNVVYSNQSARLYK